MPSEPPEMPSDGLSAVLAKMINTISNIATVRVMRGLRSIVGFNNYGFRKSITERAESVGKIEL